MRGQELWRVFASSLVEPLFEAEHGDKRVADLIDAAANALLGQHMGARERVGLADSDCPIVLSGGVIKNHPQFEEKLVKVLKRKYHRAQIIRATARNTFRPVVGALLFAVGDSSDDSLCLPEGEKLSALTESARVFAGLSNV